VNADGPLRLVTVDGFEEGLSDVEVGSFDETVSMRVVSADANMTDVVLFHEVFHCYDECRAVVCDDFGK
jgi:hypothetical protein